MPTTARLEEVETGETTLTTRRVRSRFPHGEDWGEVAASLACVVVTFSVAATGADGNLPQ